MSRGAISRSVGRPLRPATRAQVNLP